MFEEKGLMQKKTSCTLDVKESQVLKCCFDVPKKCGQSLLYLWWNMSSQIWIFECWVSEIGTMEIEQINIQSTFTLPTPRYYGHSAIKDTL